MGGVAVVGRAGLVVAVVVRLLVSRVSGGVVVAAYIRRSGHSCSTRDPPLRSSLREAVVVPVTYQVHCYPYQTLVVVAVVVVVVGVVVAVVVVVGVVLVVVAVAVLVRGGVAVVVV